MSFAEPSLDDAEQREQDDKKSILGGAIALFALLFAVVLLPSTWMATAFEAFLFGAVLCLIVWTATFFLAFRGGSNWLALIGFVTMLVAGVGGTTIKYLRDAAGANYDYSRARHRMIDTLYSSPGEKVVVSDVGGPTMSVTGRYRNKILKDRNAYAKAIEEVEMRLMLEYPQLMERSGMSDKCAKYPAISALSKKTGPAAQAYAKEARNEIENSDLNRNARREMLAEFNAAQKIFLPMQDQLWTLRSELAGHMQTACNILARGRWQDRGQLMFTDKGDYKAFAANASKISKLLNEETNIQNAALRRTVDALNGM
jgi:hypothetical protein